MERRLYRSTTNRVIAGVCGGLGEYFDIDPVLVRLAWVAAVFLGGFGLLLYVIWIFVVPLRSAVSAGPTPSSRAFPAMFGGAMILLGFALLADNLHWMDLDWMWHRSWEFIGPAILILVGLYLIARRREGPAAASEAASHEQPGSQPPPSSAAGGERLHRSVTEKKLFGICGGLAEHFHTDPTLVRLLWVGLTLAAPVVGIFGYIAGAIILPVEMKQHAPSATGAA